LIFRFLLLGDVVGNGQSSPDRPLLVPQWSGMGVQPAVGTLKSGDFVNQLTVFATKYSLVQIAKGFVIRPVYHLLDQMLSYALSGRICLHNGKAGEIHF